MRAPGVLLSLAFFALLANTACLSSSTGDSAPPSPITKQAKADADPPSAVEIVRSALAGQFRVKDPARIKLLSWERVDWPDGCLGVPVGDGACTQALAPGYRIVVELAGDGTYEYRTNLDGTLFLMAAGPAIKIESPVLTWEGIDPGGFAFCQSLTLADDGRALIGPCGAPQTPLQLFDDVRRPSQLDYFLARFAPFDADTPAGRVAFVGRGTEAAAPAWRRAVAEWARLVQRELRLGRSDASWGLALAWQQQEDGATGRCRKLQAEVYGLAFASNSRCGGGDARDLGWGWLSTTELEKLYAWCDRLAVVHRPQPELLILSGTGAEPVNDAEAKAISDWAATVYARLADDSS